MASCTTTTSARRTSFPVATSCIGVYPACAMPWPDPVRCAPLGVPRHCSPFRRSMLLGHCGYVPGSSTPEGAPRERPRSYRNPAVGSPGVQRVLRAHPVGEGHRPVQSRRPSAGLRLQRRRQLVPLQLRLGPSWERPPGTRRAACRVGWQPCDRRGWYNLSLRAFHPEQPVCIPRVEAFESAVSVEAAPVRSSGRTSALLHACLNRSSTFLASRTCP